MDFDTARANVLLDLLPQTALQPLLPELVRVSLTAGQQLYAPGAEMTRVYFPLSGLCSLVASSRGGSVDVGPIGFDGLVGLPVYLETPTGPLSATVHVSGEALHMSAAAFLSCARKLPDLE